MKKILIWGTGQIANRVLTNGIGDYGKITGFIESQKKKDSFLGFPVYSASEIPKDMDVIIVASRFSDEIYSTCIKENINIDKVLFMVRGSRTAFNYGIENLNEILGEKNHIDYQIQYGVVKDSFVDRDADLYTRLNKRADFKIQRKYMWPVINEKYAKACSISNYFWQDLWAAKKIIKTGIKKHYDIGSRVDGFIAHLLAADINVNVIDIRPFDFEADNLYTIVGDATYLDHIPDDSVESISALCSLEHFGLGRYGDPIDPEACFKCFDNIQKKIKQGGKLYISVPIGRERVEFNAHRVFFASTILESFSQMKLIEFSCATQDRIEYDADIHQYDDDIHNGDYRYGLFLFEKGK